jgi:hypothetical protein
MIDYIIDLNDFKDLLHFEQKYLNPLFLILHNQEKYFNNDTDILLIVLNLQMKFIFLIIDFMYLKFSYF